MTVLVKYKGHKWKKESATKTSRKKIQDFDFREIDISHCFPTKLLKENIFYVENIGLGVISCLTITKMDYIFI